MTVLTRGEILADVSQLLADHMGVAPSAAIDEDTRFFADLGLASIDAVVLGEALQDHYRRSLPFNDLMAEIGRRTDRDLSIGELVSFLDAHLRG
jgi:acyl carrier protein